MMLHLVQQARIEEGLTHERWYDLVAAQHSLLWDVSFAARTADCVFTARAAWIGIVGCRKIQHIAPMRETTVAKRPNIRMQRVRWPQRFSVFEELHLRSIRLGSGVPGCKLRYRRDPAIARLGFDVSRQNRDRGFLRHLAALRYLHCEAAHDRCDDPGRPAPLATAARLR